MLSEFAFTPSIFDETAHEDVDAWCDQLRKLIANMFPETSAWPIVVSNLFEGAWSSQIIPLVSEIKDPKARRLCQGLATQMKRILVLRPICGAWPDSDTAWCQEAISASQIEAIERIVSTRSTKAAMPQPQSTIRSIDEVIDRGFWAGIEPGASPRMVIADQIGLLRKICLHSQWLALINPYGFSSERDFGIKLMQASLNRNASYGRLDFEFHFQALDISDPAERTRRQQNLTTGLTQSIQPFRNKLQSVNLVIWPKLRERLLIAGVYSELSNGTRCKSPRWGVSMNHVAHQGDDAEDYTEWKLLKGERVGYWFRRYISEDAASQPPPVAL